jgi:hypothetical protein
VALALALFVHIVQTIRTLNKASQDLTPYSMGVLIGTSGVITVLPCHVARCRFVACLRARCLYAAPIAYTSW